MAEEKAGDITDKDVEEWFKAKFENWGKEMDEKGVKCKSSKGSKAYHTGAGAGGWICFFGWVGALVYYIQTANGFWDVVLGILKSIIWPAFLVHGLMQFIGL